MTDTAWEEITYSYGPKFRKLHCPDEDAEKVLKQILGDEEDLDVEIGDFTWEGYDYSLRFGVEDNPGSQGYHGLKYKISDDFLLMPESGTHFFKTHISAESKTKVNLELSGKEPDALYVNGKRIRSNKAVLKKGINSVLLMYTGVKENSFNNHWEVVDLRERSSLVFQKPGAAIEPNDLLSMKWYMQEGILDYDVYGGKKKVGYYRFKAPPGMNKMQFEAYGAFKVYQDGKEMDLVMTKTSDSKGLNSYEVAINEVKKGFSEICFEVEHIPGYYGGSAFPEPARISCGKGAITTGDWSGMGVLKAYSGGLWYRKNLTLSREQLASNIKLDLGEICATAEIHINGKFAGYCTHQPFELDITEFVKEGDNHFEILVFSTLANHYSTIPTPSIYRQSYEAGLIGPVKLLWVNGE